MVGWLTSRTSALAWSTQPGPSGPWSAFSKIRAWVSLHADSVPAASMLFNWSRSGAVRITG